MTVHANLKDLLKTPNEMASETPKETEERYNIDNTVTETDENNPRVEWSESDYIAQVPSGTHLHPDIAKDLANRGISAPTTDIGQIRKGDTFIGFDFASDLPVADVDSDEDPDSKTKVKK
jgi:hypothetical protein